jgi:tRNA (guanine-N7-)-methyltransferase
MTLEYAQRREEQLRELKARMEALPAGDYVLELGCGHGHFLTELAKRDKGAGAIRNYAAVDKNPKRIARAKKKSERAGLDIHWINARVEDVIDLWPAGRGVAEVFVLFPDPWPKSRHAKNRFVNVELSEKLAKLAPRGGKFYFRSDHLPYCAEVRELFAKSKEWEIDDKARWPTGLSATVFEEYHPEYGELIATRR